MSEFLEHIQWMHDHAEKRIEQTNESGILKGHRCIPVDSQLNAYLQGQRDTATELLARAREFKKAALPAPPSAPEELELKNIHANRIDALDLRPSHTKRSK